MVDCKPMNLTPLGRIAFDPFIIERPDGKKVWIHPLEAFVADTELEKNNKFLGQIVDAAAELEECKLYIECVFDPNLFLRKIKELGYKVYWAARKKD